MAKGFFRQINVKSAPFSTITLSVLMLLVIVILLDVADFSIEIEQQVFGVTQEGFDDTQELLL